MGVTRGKQIRLSKFLSLVLRHQPEKIGLALDSGGWTDLEDLLVRLKENGWPITKEDLLNTVHNSDKQRFALSQDGKSIRANQGHSISIQLGLDPQTPPQTLYHGTASHSLQSILRRGLNRGKRQYVHLSPHPQTAIQVGRRHGKPVVLMVAAGEMHAAGHVFFLSDNGIWLVAEVPPEYLELLSG